MKTKFPINIRVAIGPRGVTEISLKSRRSGQSDKSAKRLLAQLRKYFAGEPAEFDVPLDFSDGTKFERAVWRACMRIPRGATRTYSELAAMAGYPRAARAVGNAMARNPFPIVVPCHRVIRADGSLGRYGYGAELKRKLLELERPHGLRLLSRYSAFNISI